MKIGDCRLKRIKAKERKKALDADIRRYPRTKDIGHEFHELARKGKNRLFTADAKRKEKGARNKRIYD